MKKDVYTLNSLLDEIKKETPKLNEGDFLEVLKSIYPSDNIGGNKKNVELPEGHRATLPLACSGKSKREFKKHNPYFFRMFKDNTRGDFLEIIETDGYTAKCINRSIKEEYLNEYYEDDMKIIEVKFEDILNGSIKKVYRGIKKYI
jgi:TusA-related sulfurtransferase